AHHPGRTGGAGRAAGRVPGPDVQLAGPPAEPGRQCLGPGRRAADPAVRADPQPGGNGAGLRRARAPDAGRGHPGPRRGAVGAGPRGPGRGRRPAHRRVEEPVRGERGVPGPQGQCQLPAAAGRAGEHRGPRRVRPAVLQRRCAVLQQLRAHHPDRAGGRCDGLPRPRVLPGRGRRPGPRHRPLL
ncbi:MAG: LemA protein, partial [uncultured Corynebacteriales bacterium]